MSEQEQSMESEGFLLSEYQQAASAYFHGADMGWRAMSQFVTLNTLLFAGVGIAQEGVTSEIVTSFLKFIPIVGVVMSITIMFGFPYFLKQLKNCENRCAEIEGKFGGRLFNAIKTTGNKKYRTILSIKAIFYVFAALFLFIWLFVGYQMETIAMINNLFG